MSDSPRPPSAPQTFGTVTGPPTTVNLQQMQDLVNALNNSVRASANIYTALQNIQIAGARPPVSTVGALPAVTAANAGDLAFASNARNTGETTGNGTGTVVAVNKNGVWVAVWSGVAPTT